MSPMLLGDLGQVDRRLGGLELAEEEPPLAVLAAPVLEQVAGDRRDVRVALQRASGPTAWRISLTISFGCWRVGPPNCVHRQLARTLLRPRDRDEELADGRRRSSISPVTSPSAVVTKCRAGSTNGELMIGFSIVTGITAGDALREVPPSG